MRLPTRAEFQAAYKAKITESWEMYGRTYWTSDKHSDGYMYILSVLNEDSGDGYSTTINIKHVRCIRN